MNAGMRLCEIEDELNAILVQQAELRQQEVRLMHERREIRAALAQSNDGGECLMTNCRKRAPKGEAMCAEHR